MNELAEAYIEYIAKLKTIRKPQMPKFDLSAYNDNNYKRMILNLNQEFDCFDDLNVYLAFLKGE